LHFGYSSYYHYLLEYSYFQICISIFPRGYDFRYHPRVRLSPLLHPQYNHLAGPSQAGASQAFRPPRRMWSYQRAPGKENAFLTRRHVIEQCLEASSRHVSVLFVTLVPATHPFFFFRFTTLFFWVGLPTTGLCVVRIVFPTMGFALFFGAILAKTGRMFFLFRAFKKMKKPTPIKGE
jgi:hypothetical protein